MEDDPQKWQLWKWQCINSYWEFIAIKVNIDVGEQEIAQFLGYSLGIWWEEQASGHLLVIHSMKENSCSEIFSSKIILIPLPNSCHCSKSFSFTIQSPLCNLAAQCCHIGKGSPIDLQRIGAPCDLPLMSQICNGENQATDNGLAEPRRSTIWGTPSQRRKTRSDRKPGTYSCRRESFLLWGGVSPSELQVSAWLHIFLAGKSPFET